MLLLVSTGWSAQWLLKTQVNIDTGNVKPEQIPNHLTLTQNRKGQWQAGLFNAWQLVKYHTKGRATVFITEQENILRSHIEVRNTSILAHGFTPIQNNQWQPIYAWLESQFIPMLLEETAKSGIKSLPAQLPDDYPG